MAGTIAFVPRKGPPAKMATSSTVRERWEVHFSRFFGYPPLSSTCPDLNPLPTRVRNRRPSGNWVSSSSTALLQLAHDHSNSDVLLTVFFGGKVLEEHHVSKLQFVWPHVSCNPGYPIRGIRALFVSYRDCAGEVQKFALRFLSVAEAERFMNSLREIFNIGKDNAEPLNTDLGSEISAQSKFMSSNGPPTLVCTDLNTMTSAQTYTAQISPSLNNEADQQYLCTQDMPHTHDFERNLALPPSFTSLLSDSYPVVQQVATLNDVRAAPSNVSGAVNLNPQIMSPRFTSWLGNCNPVFEQVAAQSTVSQQVNPKSPILGHVGDVSFQDMLNTMERAISEMGGDLTL